MATRTETQVVMPQMGVSVAEGTITKWLKQVGESVALDEPLLEISTDKVDTEVPSPGEGVVAQILHQEGETVEVGTVLAVIAPAGAASAEAIEAPPEPATQDADEAVTTSSSADDGMTPTPASPAPSAPPPLVAPIAPTPVPVLEAPPSGNGKTFVSPVVARIAAEHGVDPSAVPGTGQGGRVTKKDILAYIEAGPPAPPLEAPAPPLEAPAPPPETPTPPPEAPAPPAPVPVAAAPTPPAAPSVPPATPPVPPTARPVPPAPVAEPEAAPGETLEPITAMRRGVMEHMRRSLDTSAHVTSAIEVDMSRVVAIRDTLKREYTQSYGVNPTYLAFIARATVETLKDWPWVNGEIRGDKIVSRQFVNLGIAVALEGGKGLIVPVIRHAEGLNLVGMARAIADLAERARTKKLLPDDVQGGTFTITNPGGFGTFHGTPIINQPQVAILGTYAVVKRAWVVQDELGGDVLAIRPLMNLTLTYDHRLVDGAYAGGFLRDLRERLESWDESAN